VEEKGIAKVKVGKFLRPLSGPLLIISPGCLLGSQGGGIALAEDYSCPLPLPGYIFFFSILMGEEKS